MAASPAGGLCSASREHEGGPALLLLGAGGLGAVLSGPTPAGLGDASHGAGALAALAGLPENVLYNGAVYWKNDTFVALKQMFSDLDADDSGDIDLEELMGGALGLTISPTLTHGMRCTSHASLSPPSPPLRFNIASTQQA